MQILANICSAFAAATSAAAAAVDEHSMAMAYGILYRQTEANGNFVRFYFGSSKRIGRHWEKK